MYLLFGLGLSVLGVLHLGFVVSPESSGVVGLGCFALSLLVVICPNSFIGEDCG